MNVKIGKRRNILLRLCQFIIQNVLISNLKPKPSSVKIILSGQLLEKDPVTRLSHFPEGLAGHPWFGPLETYNLSVELEIAGAGPLIYFYSDSLTLDPYVDSLIYKADK